MLILREVRLALFTNLAERIKRLIEKIVNKHQCHHKGRQIIDASLIAKECVDAR